MTLDKIRVGILGSTGLVGQQFVKMLDNHPYFEITVLSASSRSTGKRYSEAADWLVSSSIPESAQKMILIEAKPKILKEHGVKVLFSAMPSDASRELEKALAREGFSIFTNASAHRMDRDVPIVIPEVNPEHFEMIKAQKWSNGGFIVTNSNCSTTGLVMGLKPLSRFGLKSVTVSTYQALSGAGRRGVASLDILGNILPYIKDEEEKIERETKKILGRFDNGNIIEAPLEVNASCCRVPTRNGHLESIVVETEDDVDTETITEVFKDFKAAPQEIELPTAPEKPIFVADEKNRPQPLRDAEAGAPERAKGMSVTVGRIRKKGKKINFFLLVHNTVRGAAGTCILNAEFAVKKKYIPRGIA